MLESPMRYRKIASFIDSILTEYKYSALLTPSSNIGHKDVQLPFTLLL
jgi:hypothetical protein